MRILRVGIQFPPDLSWRLPTDLVFADCIPTAKVRSNATSETRLLAQFREERAHFPSPGAHPFESSSRRHSTPPLAHREPTMRVSMRIQCRLPARATSTEAQTHRARASGSRRLEGPNASGRLRNHGVNAVLRHAAKVLQPPSMLASGTSGRQFAAAMTVGSL